eukprot:COSAG01_NODE_519_length_16012_cov_4.344058_13_plen_196_part_00
MSEAISGSMSLTSTAANMLKAPVSAKDSQIQRSDFNAMLTKLLHSDEQTLSSSKVQMNNVTNVALPPKFKLANNMPLLAQAAASVETAAIEKKKKRPRLSELERKKEAELAIVNFDHSLPITPFQYFTDQAMKSLKDISDQEFRVNDLMQKYVEKKVSIEEVSIETTKLNLSIAFATTVITTAAQTLKEFVSMQI